MSLFGEDVAAGVRAGDPDSVGIVYLALKDRLLSYLSARVRDHATAEDLLELTFLELLQRGHTIRGGSAAIKVWLFRSAHFNALDYHRRNSRRGEELSDDMARLESEDPSRGPEDLAVASDESSRVRAAMQRLSEEQRHVIELRYVHGLSAPEIGEVLDKSDGAIRSLQHRGERSLARLLMADTRGDTEVALGTGREWVVTPPEHRVAFWRPREG